MEQYLYWSSYVIKIKSLKCNTSRYHEFKEGGETYPHVFPAPNKVQGQEKEKGVDGGESIGQERYGEGGEGEEDQGQAEVPGEHKDSQDKVRHWRCEVWPEKSFFQEEESELRVKFEALKSKLKLCKNEENKLKSELLEK